MSKDINRRIAELKAKYNIPIEAPRLTKPTEESYLNQAVRIAKQVPRGIASGAAGLLSLPGVLSRGHIPGSGLQEKTNEYLDTKYPGSAPAGFVGRAVKSISENLGGMGTLGRAGKVAQITGGASKIGRAGASLAKSSRLGKASNIGSAIGSGLASQVSAEKDDPSPTDLAIASVLGGWGGGATAAVAGKGLSKLTSRTPSLASQDALVKKSITDYKKKATEQYKSIMTPIEGEISAKKGKVSLDSVIEPLRKEMNKLDSHKAKRHFLKHTEEGKILEELLGYPKEVSFAEAQKIKEMIAKKADTLGAFDVTKTKTGSDLAKINRNFKEAMEETVEKTAPKSLESYREANRIWANKRQNIDPLIDDMSRNQHLLGSSHKTSLQDVGEGATHARFVHENLAGKDKKAYAKAIMEEIGGIKKTVGSIFKAAPEQHRGFYQTMGKSPHSLVRQALTPSPGNLTANALASMRKPVQLSEEESMEARARAIRAKYGL